MNKQYKKDLLWASIASLLILIWGSIPTLAGNLIQTRDLRFRGLYFDPQDYAVDISMMRAGMQGEWAYQFRFTSESPHPAYVRMFYITLGHISNAIGLPPELAYHLARWIFGFLALISIYILFRQIFSEPFWARTGFLLAALGSGLGWLQLIFHWVPGPITPIDYWLIDASVFFSLSLFPHFAFILAGMSLATTFWLSYLRTHEWRNVGWISFIAILIQLVNPIAFAVVDIGFVGAALFSWWKSQRVNRSDILAIFALAIIQLPLLAYNLAVLIRDPSWSQYTQQNQTLSPPFVYYIWGFALFWPLTIMGATLAVRQKSPAMGAALHWTALAFVMAYLPVYIQRRFLFGVTIPMSILSTTALMTFFGSDRAKSASLHRRRVSLVFLFIFLAAFSSLYIGIGQTLYLNTFPKKLFYPASIDDAVQWLNQYAEPNEFVLASEETSQIIAQKTNLKVYYGHEMETLGYYPKQKATNSFYAGGQTADWLKNTGVSWVIYGPFEREISKDFLPRNDLKLVDDQSDLQLYMLK